jgi:hypothetical protein
MKQYRVVLAVCLGVIAFVPPCWSAPSSAQLPDATMVSHSLSALSVPFIENRGQIDRHVAYYAKTFGTNLFVTRKGEMVYGFPDYALIERITGLLLYPKDLPLPGPMSLPLSVMIPPSGRKPFPPTPQSP